MVLTFEYEMVESPAPQQNPQETASSQSVNELPSNANIGGEEDELMLVREATKSGYLVKMSPETQTLKNWKKRWFVANVEIYCLKVIICLQSPSKATELRFYSQILFPPN